MSVPTFSGEMQFAGYSDSSRSGPVVRFRLADRADLEAFIGLEGRRYMGALVEIADDETPAQPKPEAPKGGERARWVAMRCAEPDFQHWLWHKFALHRPGPDVVGGKNVAASMVRAVCGVESRAELDSDKYAPHRFDVLIRKAWQEHRGVTA